MDKFFAGMVTGLLVERFHPVNSGSRVLSGLNEVQMDAVNAYVIPASVFAAILLLLKYAYRLLKESENNQDNLDRLRRNSPS